MSCPDIAVAQAEIDTPQSRPTYSAVRKSSYDTFSIASPSFLRKKEKHAPVLTTDTNNERFGADSID